MMVDFNENVLPQGGPGDPQGDPKGAQMAPRRASWPPRNRPNEAASSSECTQKNTSKIDIDFEDSKVIKKRL